MEPLIGVGIPVWRGGTTYVAETLRSVLNQRGIHFKVIVSIDGADPGSERVCQSFASDPRVQIVVQPRRLGWVKNTAAVLSAALEGAEFVCVLPHDDWIEPDYLSTLLDTARKCSHASVVYSDLNAFGTMHGVTSQDSVTGTPIARQLALLRHHYNAVAYRGLVRAFALRSLPPMSGNDCADFACDTIWMARLARAGELVRVPEVLYHKRYAPTTTHAAWTNWPLEQKVAAWVQHCLDMLAEALTVARDVEDRQLLIEAARCRLMLSNTDLGPYSAEIKAMLSRQRWRMQAVFETDAAARSDIGPLGHTPRDYLLRRIGRLIRIADQI